MLRFTENMPTPFLQEVLLGPLLDRYELFESTEHGRIHMPDVHESRSKVVRLHTSWEVEPHLLLTTRSTRSIPNLGRELPLLLQSRPDELMDQVVSFRLSDIAILVSRAVEAVHRNH